MKKAITAMATTKVSPSEEVVEATCDECDEMYVVEDGEYFLGLCKDCVRRIEDDEIFRCEGV